MAISARVPGLLWKPGSSWVTGCKLKGLESGKVETNSNSVLSTEEAASPSLFLGKVPFGAEGLNLLFFA